MNDSEMFGRNSTTVKQIRKTWDATKYQRYTKTVERHKKGLWRRRLPDTTGSPRNHTNQWCLHTTNTIGPHTEGQRDACGHSSCGKKLHLFLQLTLTVTSFYCPSEGHNAICRLVRPHSRQPELSNAT